MSVASQLIPIHLLAAGQQAIIGAVLGTAEQVHRLTELGLRDGAAVEMVRPGSPCIIRLAGQQFCFRGDDLLRVLVQVESDA